MNGYKPDLNPLIKPDEPDEMTLEHPKHGKIASDPKNDSLVPKDTDSKDDPTTVWIPEPVEDDEKSDPNDNPKVRLKNKDTGKYMGIKKDPKTGELLPDCNCEKDDPDNIFNVILKIIF